MKPNPNRDRSGRMPLSDLEPGDMFILELENGIPIHRVVRFDFKVKLADGMVFAVVQNKVVAFPADKRVFFHPG